MWDAFDAAYPEYEMIFAHDDAEQAELRLLLSRRNMAFLVFDRAPRRRIETATAGIACTTFYASYAPVPLLEKEGVLATGFMIDTVDRWMGARRVTEIDTFLEHFSLAGRESLIADGQTLCDALKVDNQGDGCLIVATGNVPLRATVATPPNDALDELADTYGLDRPRMLFDLHHSDHWYQPEVITRFLEQLEDCRTVVVQDSPLGFLALLSGCEVIVGGRPFWAGFGPSTDKLSILRRRKLDCAEMAGIVVLLLSRYVNDDYEIIDPADGWTHARTALPLTGGDETATTVYLA